MKILKEYLTLTESKDFGRLSDGLDLRNYSWPKHGISENTLEKCKDNVREYAIEHYLKQRCIRDHIEELLKDTYIDYGMYDFNWTEQKSEK